MDEPDPHDVMDLEQRIARLTREKRLTGKRRDYVRANQIEQSLSELGSQLEAMTKGTKDANYKGFNIIPEGGKFSVKNVMGGRMSVHATEAEAKAEVDRIAKSRTQDCSGTKDCGCGGTHDAPRWAETPSGKRVDLNEQTKVEGGVKGWAMGQNGKAVPVYIPTKDAAPKGKNIHIHVHR